MVCKCVSEGDCWKYEVNVTEISSDDTIYLISKGLLKQNKTAFFTVSLLLHLIIKITYFKMRTVLFNRSVTRIKCALINKKKI